MKRFVPFPSNPEDVPIDLRFMFKNECPAGKHGFLKCNGDHFIFEDGTKARFWGTNFNGGSNFPEFSYSEKVARRLAKLGCNIVRFHQLDAEWNTPNIFQFTKGEHKGNTLCFDEQSMDLLDYLIFCLKREGIYVYMDILTYRKFKLGDGVKAPERLKDSGKPYSIYNRKMIDLQKELAYNFWNHYNPYTKLKHKDDPVFALGEVTNENDLFSIYKIEEEPYVSEFRNIFRDWLSKQNINYDADNCNVNGIDKELLEFKVQLQESYYKEIINYLREIGVKIPMAGTNWTVNGYCAKTQMVGDFTDSHSYFYDWRWGELEKHCINTALTHGIDTGLGTLANARSVDKPFFVSEWDMPWPNEFRAESPILYAAVGAFQDWTGFAIHTYAYTSDLEKMQMLGKEVSSNTIGGVPYREGIFSTWNDPAKFGLFYHSAIITRRGDVSVGKNITAVKVSDMNDMHFNSAKPAFLAPEKTRLGITFEDDYAQLSEEDTLLFEESGCVCSDNGELFRDWNKNYGTIDTAMTKCAYGFLGKNSPIELDGVTIKAKTDFSVIALSSLTDKQISETPNILLTTVGRAVNTDAKFAGELMLDFGKPPILIEVIEVEMQIRTKCKLLSVWAVSAEGLYIGKVPSSYEDDMLCFTLGKTFPSMYYLIQSE